MTAEQLEARMVELGERVFCAELFESVFPLDAIRRRVERRDWALWFERNNLRH